MEKGLLEIGELVKPDSPTFQEFYDHHYNSPGIILKVEKIHTGGGHYRKSYKIRWNDGKITNEHTCYIKKVTI
jgi:hypothetical protein